MNGSYAQPDTGNEQKYRFVLTQTADRHVLTLYFALPDAKEAKVAETIYSR
jgi:hypothetical protein